MLIPFPDKEWKGLDFVAVFQDTLMHLMEVLQSVFQSNAGKGGFDAAWTAYQVELALEEHVYGHPLSHADVRHFEILGTSPSGFDTLNGLKGFLTLVPHSYATNYISPPPIQNWTRDPTQTLRVERAFALTECLGASPSVIEAKLWLSFL